LVLFGSSASVSALRWIVSHLPPLVFGLVSTSQSNGGTRQND
jgi:hypothetical protein